MYVCPMYVCPTDLQPKIDDINPQNIYVIHVFRDMYLIDIYDLINT